MKKIKMKNKMVITDGPTMRRGDPTMRRDFQR